MAVKDISSVGSSSTPGSSSNQLETAIVQDGENLAQIALRLGFTEEQLFQANPNLNSPNLQPGQEIRLPDAPSLPAAPNNQTQVPKDMMEVARNPKLLDQLLNQPAGVKTPADAYDAGKDLGFNPGMMQFTGFPVLAGPGPIIKAVQLTAEQATAKAELEKSPAWSKLSDGQKNQISKDLSKLSGDKLKNEATKIQERLASIETLAGHGAWKELAPAQQQRITDKMLKLSGDGLKKEADQNKADLDSIKNMSQHDTWKTLTPPQKQQLTDQVFKLTGDKEKQYLEQTQKDFDSIKKLSEQDGWKKLAPAQQQQVAGEVLKRGGAQEKQYLDQTQKDLDNIKKLSDHDAWKQLGPAQQQQVAGEVLKRGGAQEKQYLDQTQKDLNNIKKLSDHDAWKQLGPAQQQQVVGEVLKRGGSQEKQYLDQTQKRFDSIKSLATEPSWTGLGADAHQKIAGQLLKVSDRNLQQTTDNLRSTVKIVGSLKTNGADIDKTLDKILKTEADGPKSFKKMTGAFTDAQKQIDASQNKKNTATDIRDMIDMSIDRARGDRNHKDLVDVKSEIFKRFVKQYETNPADFAEVRTALTGSPATSPTLAVHWAHPDRVGVEFAGGERIAQTALDTLYREKNIPAGEQSKYRHALNILVRVEGKLDNVNAWDSGVFSLGIKQWTTHQGSLAPLLSEFQRAHPQRFQELLPGVQVQGNEVTFNGKSLLATGNRSSRDVVGNLSQSEIVKLSKMLNNLGQDADFQAIQLGRAVDRIRQIENMPVGQHQIGDYIQTDRAWGHIVDFDPNRPAWVNPSFTEAVQKTAKEFGLTGTPSRQELLNALKDKVDKDPEFQKKITETYGADMLENLKNENNRAAFLERRLSELFRDQFISREGNASHRQGLTNRYRNTSAYYDGV